jgi:hypothetical protein
LPLAELKLECIPDLIFPDPVPNLDLDPDSTQNGIAREKKFKNQGMR